MIGSTTTLGRGLQALLGGVLLAVGAGSSASVLAEAGARSDSPPSAVTTSDQATDRRLDQLFGEHQTYRVFFENFQKAVLAGDKSTVAAVIHYPITVHLDGKQWTLYNAKEFAGVYAHIFTPDLVEVVRRQRYDDLFVNDQGVMIGQGAIWFSGICEDAECEQMPLRVIALNLPARH
ncbi:hypothetical protein ACYJW8_13230 [Frateuria aurantia]